jgi:hypothetical protein
VYTFAGTSPGRFFLSPPALPIAYPIPSFFAFWGNRRVVVSGYPKPVISGLIQSFNRHLVASVFAVSAYM